MVANSVLRRDYSDLIISFTGPRCDHSPTKTTTVWFPAAGASYPSGRVGLKVANVAAQAFRALAAVMLHYGYAFEERAGGTLNCRYIGGTTVVSFHALGTAGDFNPSRNGYRREGGLIQWGRQTDMPKAMVLAIEAIKSVSGHKIFEWGGRWLNIKDPMHYELDIARAHLTTGTNLSTLPAGAWSRYKAWLAGSDSTGGDDQMLDTNSPKPSRAVAVFQRDLITLGYDLGTFTPFGAGFPPGADGAYGPTATAATSAFQTDNNLEATGKGDALTVGIAGNLARLKAGAGSTIDQEARNQARAAREVADKAKAAADRANTTLNKIRSE